MTNYLPAQGLSQQAQTLYEEPKGRVYSSAVGGAVG
jgi:hypothetical protein